MWIILEGPDAVGKSTLTNLLHKRIPTATLLSLGPPDSPEQSLDRVLAPPVAMYVPGSGADIVCDRWHWGDPIYGPLYRPDTNVDDHGDMGKAGFRYAELFVESRGGCVFLLKASIDDMIEKFNQRGDDYALADDLAAIAMRYEELAAESLTFTATVPMALDAEWPESDDAEDTLDWIIDEAQSKESRYESLAKFKHYVGPANPAMLIVCKPDRDLRLEVVGALADDVWKSAGIASTAMSPALLDELWRTLDKPMTVGLGVVPTHLQSVLDEIIDGPADLNLGRLASLT